MYIKTGTSTWKNTAQLYIKTGASIWTRIRQGYIKTSASTWKRFFYEANLPLLLTAPKIHVTNTSGTGTIYDGANATSPQYLNSDLFGKDGTYSNYTSISGRRFSYADSLDAATRTTIVYDDRYTSAGGVTTAMRLASDEKYVFYELIVSNGADDFIVPVSTNPVKMIKQSPPFATTITLTGTQQPSNSLTFDFTLQNNYYNRLEYANATDSSVIRWWRSPGPYLGGEMVKEETLYSTQYSVNSTSFSGLSTYFLTDADLGYYIYVQIVGRNSWTRHFGYPDYEVDYTTTSGKILGPISISNVYTTDYNGNTSLDNKGNLTASNISYINASVSNVDDNTSYRIRYRAYNNSNGNYVNPDTLTAYTAANSASAWFSKTADYAGSGTLTNVSIDNGTATIKDIMPIASSTFNGGTYSGGNPTWRWDIEISAIRTGSSRVIYSSPYISYSLSPSATASISLNPTSISPGGSTTISGSITAVPSNYTAYPRQYRVDYGDGNNSGWLPVGEWSSGTGNPTYSLTHTYSTAGTYYPGVETIPEYTKNYATLNVATKPGAFNISSVTKGAYDLNQGARPVTVSWGASTNAVKYRVQIERRDYIANMFPNASQTWVVQQAYTSDAGTTLTSKTFYPGYYWAYRVFVVAYDASDNASNVTFSNGGTSSNYIYVEATGTAPQAITMESNANATKTGTTLSIDYTLPTNTGSTSIGKVFYKIGSAGTWTEKSTTASPLDLSGLTASTTYNVYMKCMNYDGLESLESSVSYTTASVATAPTSLTATTTDSAKITLTWSGGSGDGYQIYYANTTGVTNTPTTHPSTIYDFSSTSSPLDVLANSRGSYRRFWVRAYTGTLASPTSTSAWYPVSTGDGVLGYEPLYAPNTVTPTGGTTTDISIAWSWTAPTTDTTHDAASSYDYAISTSTTTPTSWTNTTSTSVTTSSLTASTTYYLHVRAKNADATGASNYGTKTTTAGASAPGTPVVTGDNTLSIGGTFNWTCTGSPSPVFRVTIGYHATSLTGPFTTRYQYPAAALTTSNGVTKTSIQPGYAPGGTSGWASDGTSGHLSPMWAGAGYYRCTIQAINSQGNSSGSVVTYMS